MKYYFQLYFAFLCLFDDWARIASRSPSNCAVSVCYSRCLDRKNLSRRQQECSTWQCCLFLIGARGPRVFSFLNGNPSLLLKVSFSVSTSSLVKSSPCCKSWISPDRLAVLDSSCWSLTHKKSWRLWLSELSLSIYTTKLLTSRINSSKFLSLSISSRKFVVPSRDRWFLLMLSRVLKV